MFLKIGRRCAFMPARSFVCRCTYRANVHLFPHFKRERERDRRKRARYKDTSLRSKRTKCGSLSGLTCIHRLVRMCQRACLLPCLASVKAVYIGPDGGGNSAQLPGSPRAPHAEQWTEPTVDLQPPYVPFAPPVLKTRAAEAASCFRGG